MVDTGRRAHRHQFAAGIGYPSAIGAFIAAGVLMCLTALIKPVARMIERIPASVASAMLAGVLVRYCLGVPGAAIELAWQDLPGKLDGSTGHAHGIAQEHAGEHGGGD